MDLEIHLPDHAAILVELVPLPCLNELEKTLTNEGGILCKNSNLGILFKWNNVDKLIRAGTQ